jgi:formate hydrogenlyase subunit 4
MTETLLLQLLAVLVVFGCSPLLRGAINRLKAIIQSKRGASIWQPYYDYWKLLHKGSVISEHTT